jgi:hypothetical protein
MGVGSRVIREMEGWHLPVQVSPLLQELAEPAFSLRQARAGYEAGKPNPVFLGDAVQSSDGRPVS